MGSSSFPISIVPSTPTNSKLTTFVRDVRTTRYRMGIEIFSRGSTLGLGLGFPSLLFPRRISFPSSHFLKGFLSLSRFFLPCTAQVRFPSHPRRRPHSLLDFVSSPFPSFPIDRHVHRRALGETTTSRGSGGDGGAWEDLATRRLPLVSGAHLPPTRTCRCEPSRGWRCTDGSTDEKRTKKEKETKRRNHSKWTWKKPSRRLAPNKANNPNKSPNFASIARASPPTSR